MPWRQVSSINYNQPSDAKRNAKNFSFPFGFRLYHATHNVPIIYVLLLLLRDFCFLRESFSFFASNANKFSSTAYREPLASKRKTSKSFPSSFPTTPAKGVENERRKEKKSWKRNSSPCAFRILSAAFSPPFTIHVDGKMKSYISVNCIRCV